MFIESGSDGVEVSAALERLAAKQKRRQYSATNVCSTVLSSSSMTQCSRETPNDGAPGRQPKRVRSAQLWARSRPGQRRPEEGEADSRRGGSRSGLADRAVGTRYLDDQRCVMDRIKCLYNDSQCFSVDLAVSK